MHIVVTGGTGLIGRYVVPALLEKGYRVTLLTRRPHVAENLFAQQTTNIMWPMKDDDNPWASYVQACDAVIHLAGETIAQPWTQKRKQRILASRVHNTRLLIEAMQDGTNRPSVLLSASAVGYYGPSEAPVTELTPPGDDFLAHIVQQWEAEAKMAQQLGVRVITMRTGVFLSPQGGVLQRLLIPFRLYVGGHFGKGTQWFPWIHANDWVQLLMFCLEHDSLSGPINMTAPHPVRMKELAKTLGHVLQRPAVCHIPAPLLKLVLGEMSTLLLDGQHVVPHVAQQHGFSFQFPHIQPALEHLLA